MCADVLRQTRKESENPADRRRWALFDGVGIILSKAQRGHVHQPTNAGGRGQGESSRIRFVAPLIAKALGSVSSFSLVVVSLLAI